MVYLLFYCFNLQQISSIKTNMMPAHWARCHIQHKAHVHGRIGVCFSLHIHIHAHFTWDRYFHWTELCTRSLVSYEKYCGKPAEISSCFHAPKFSSEITPSGCPICFSTTSHIQCTLEEYRKTEYHQTI